MAHWSDRSIKDEFNKVANEPEPKEGDTENPTGSEDDVHWEDRSITEDFNKTATNSDQRTLTEIFNEAADNPNNGGGGDNPQTGGDGPGPAPGDDPALDDEPEPLGPAPVLSEEFDVAASWQADLHDQLDGIEQHQDAEWAYDLDSTSENPSGFEGSAVSTDSAVPSGPDRGADSGNPGMG